MTDDAEGVLTVSLGTFQRSTTASSKGTRRTVYIQDCVVSEGGKIHGRDDCINLIEIYANEAKKTDSLWEDDPEKIGVLNTERLFINIFLLGDAFDSLWIAAAATDGARRFMSFQYRVVGNNVVSIVAATLGEFMPSSAEIAFDKKTDRAASVFRWGCATPVARRIGMNERKL
jgi:hypothetical protein